MILEYTDILQKNISIESNNKIIRQGKLLLVSQKDFYYTFTILIKGLHKKYEIPYPFAIIKEKDQIIFDYRVDTLCSNETVSNDVLSTSKSLSPNRFFNNIISIKLS